MPELPEVEIAREKLETWLAGRRILRASLPDRILRGAQSRRRVEAVLAGARVQGVDRRGKFLLFDLGPNRARLLAHLGMTGRFERLRRGESKPRFTRAILELSNGELVAFSDMRRLGELRLVADREQARLDALGLEPLGDGFNGKVLFALTHRSVRPIKVFLMDQHKVAGLGNIHAAEALFLARIHPAIPANELRRVEVTSLARAIRRCLRTEIARFRRAERYVHEGGENHFHVYGRLDEPCPRCRTPIRKLTQGGRSSYYCPACQGGI